MRKILIESTRILTALISLFLYLYEFGLADSKVRGHYELLENLLTWFETNANVIRYYNDVMVVIGILSVIWSVDFFIHLLKRSLARNLMLVTTIPIFLFNTYICVWYLYWEYVFYYLF